MRVRLIKHFKCSFSEQNYMVARHGNLPITPFIGLQIDVREKNKESVIEYVVKRVIVSFDEEDLVCVIVEPLEPEEENFASQSELSARIKQYVDGGWELDDLLASALGL